MEATLSATHTSSASSTATTAAGGHHHWKARPRKSDALVAAPAVAAASAVIAATAQPSGMRKTAIRPKATSSRATRLWHEEWEAMRFPWRGWWLRGGRGPCLHAQKGAQHGHLLSRVALALLAIQLVLALVAPSVRDKI